MDSVLNSGKAKLWMSIKHTCSVLHLRLCFSQFSNQILFGDLEKKKDAKQREAAGEFSVMETFFQMLSQIFGDSQIRRANICIFKKMLIQQKSAQGFLPKCCGLEEPCNQHQSCTNPKDHYLTRDRILHDVARLGVCARACVFVSVWEGGGWQQYNESLLETRSPAGPV